MWSILLIEQTAAVGPFRSRPPTGEAPSENGVAAGRPSGVAPVSSPK